MKNTMRILALAVIAMTVVGCKRTPTKVVDPTKTETVTAIDDSTKGNETDGEAAIWATNDPRKVLDGVACMKQRVVTFDLDRTEVKGEFEATIKCHARFLKTFSVAKLGLEGHTDERGTREYNLGLGERRGNAVSDMLKVEGAAGEQINVTSYGEERPTCTESDESCWGQNRRAEFVYSGF
jgi:peptidoglycan-associated lipoprotein